MNKLMALIVFSLLFSFGMMSQAKTPDGETPSEETACDAYEGAAFGLCNAYCEAMDCDSAEPQASEKACEKVLGNFRKKTGEEMPICTVLPPNECDPECEGGQICIDGQCCLEGRQVCTILPAGAVCEDGINCNEPSMCTDNNFCCAPSEPDCGMR